MEQNVNGKLRILVKYGLKVLEDKVLVYCSVTEISPFYEARINMYCLTLAPEDKKGSSFLNSVLVFSNEMTRSVQRPCNPKPQKEGGDGDRDRERKRKKKASTKERSKFRALRAINHKITTF